MVIVMSGIGPYVYRVVMLECIVVRSGIKDTLTSFYSYVLFIFLLNMFTSDVY